MSRKPYRNTFLVLLLLSVLLRIFAGFPSLVESWYAQTVYPVLALGLRAGTGWLPLSLGDLLYLLSGGWLIWSIYSLVRLMVKRQWSVFNPWKFTSVLLFIYLYFNVAWGLNYNRLGISYQLQLEVNEPRNEELTGLTEALLAKTNLYAGEGGRKRYPSRASTHAAAIQGYRLLSNHLPYLRYRFPSLKASAFGVLGNYMGYTGYYNPFTGEAQVNEAVPGFLHPFVTCHEIAHQLGYAKENEANFVGFLAARQSPDSLFRYSAYLDMFLYANGQLYREDSVAARVNLKRLAPQAQRDLAELRAFRIRYQTPLESWVDRFYNQFLVMNQQPAGTKTYGRVVLWLLAEYKQKGEI
jgi:Protein of unknown function (DUF3810)